MSALSKLSNLLLSLFGPEELRTFLLTLPGAENLLGVLPGELAAPVHLARETALALQRRALADGAFFVALLKERPGRKEAIQDVAQEWGLQITGELSTWISTPPPQPSRKALPQPPTRWDVFISYAHADQDAVHILANNLHQRGVDVFLDEWEIGPGDVVVHRLDRGLRESRNGIIVVSETSMVRPWVLQEYASLLTASVNRGLRLIPVLLERAEMPPMLATRAWVDLQGKRGDAYRMEVRRIADVLKGERSSRRPPRTGTLQIP